MSNHEPGSQPVTIFLGNAPVSTLNPLPTTGGGGGHFAVPLGESVQVAPCFAVERLRWPQIGKQHVNTPLTGH